MAVNLAKAGFDVVGYNRGADKVQKLVDAGGRAAKDVPDVVGDADVIITSLPDSPDVEAVATGEDGIFASARAGALYIDMSDPPRRCGPRGRGRAWGRATRARRTGERRRGGAIEGVLSIMVGGEPTDFEAARPVLDTVGRTIVHVGPAGSGQTVKAANQLIVAGNIQLLAEAILFLEAHEVETAPRARSAGRRARGQHRARPEGRGHARSRVHQLSADPAQRGKGGQFGSAVDPLLPVLSSRRGRPLAGRDRGRPARVSASTCGTGLRC